MKGLFRGRSKELENTVFTILAPDGVTPLVRGSRSPLMTFRTKERFLEALAEISEEHGPDETSSKKKGKSDTPPALPTYEDLRLSLDVASCDSRPLVVIHATDDEVLASTRERVARLAWGPHFVGRLHYAVASAEELEVLTGLPETEEDSEGFILVVSPGEYGLTGKVLANVELDAPVADLKDSLDEALGRYDPETKNPGRHVREGRRRGVTWETDIPITDGRQSDRRRRR